MAKRTQVPGIAAEESPFISRVAYELAGAHRGILELGLRGRTHAPYLAGMGHQVLRVYSDPGDTRRANIFARENSILGCMFMTADIGDDEALVDIIGTQSFDAVVADNVLNKLPKKRSLEVIRTVQRVTVLDGLNAIQGPLVDTTKIARSRETDRMFTPGELAGLYDEGAWKMLRVDEDSFRMKNIFDQQQVASQSSLLARRIGA